jgi:hypothetical protein
MVKRAAAAVIATAVLAGTAQAAGPRAVLFTKGYNLCRAASLSAVRKAGGQPYRAGLFANGVCTWERADLHAGAALATHPPAAGSSLIASFVRQNGKGGITARRIAVAGARTALLVTMPAQQGRGTKYLFAAYKAGTIQINVTAPGVVGKARVLALLAAFTR